MNSEIRHICSVVYNRIAKLFIDEEPESFGLSYHIGGDAIIWSMHWDGISVFYHISNADLCTHFDNDDLVAKIRFGLMERWNMWSK